MVKINNKILNTKKRVTAKLIVRFISLLVIFGSLLVIFGWIFGSTNLTRFFVGNQNMVLSTAISFILLSIVLWIISRDGGLSSVKKKIFIPSLLTYFIVLLFLIISLSNSYSRFNINDFTQISISFILFSPMSPVTIICFSLLLIIPFSIFSESKRLKERAITSGLIVFIFGSTGVLGYLLELPFLYYKINFSNVPMAFPTALMFSLIGIAFIISPYDFNSSVKPYGKK